MSAPDLGSRHLVTHVDDRVLHVRIDRVEKRNAFTQDMYRGLKRAAIWADRQPELDAVCLTGTGEWFGAGGDLAGQAEDPEGLAAEWDGTDHFPFRHIERCRKLWVAKINGACHAGGLDLALHCDVTVASDRARFRVPELLRGLPDPFMSARLVDVVGLSRARYLFFTAAELDAAAAGAMGLVGEVVPHDELDARTEWVLEQIRSTGPVAACHHQARPQRPAPGWRRGAVLGPRALGRDGRGHGRLRRETSRRMAPPVNHLALTPTVTRVGGSLGAQVDGLDLTRPLDHAAAALVRDALHEHSVLFFRDQDLTEEEQIAFASQFGKVAPYALTRMLGGESLTSIIEDTADSPPDADGWHTDVSWVAEPPAYAVLNARLIPPAGGDTMWSSLFAAYDALSPVMQRVCEGLVVRHHAGQDFHERIERTVGVEIADRVVREFPPVEHPLVRTHPATGRRALWVSGRFMDQVVGMHRDESEAFLAYLNHHIENPNFCVRWRWRADDLAMWDEASTNHRALSDHFPQHRVMRRCTVEGTRPFFRS